MPRSLPGPRWLIPTAGALCALLGVIAWTATDTPSTTAAVRIGYVHDPPYMFQGDDGRPRGLDIDVLAEAARRARVDVAWTYVTAPGSADAALASGAVDVWPALTILDQRRRVLHFTAPWLRADVLLVVRDDGPRPPRSYTGPIAVVALPVTEFMAGRSLPRARRLTYRDGAAITSALCAGEVPMALMAAGDLAAALADPEGQCRAARLRSHAMPDSRLDIAIAARAGYEPIADRLREGIDEMAADGSIRTLVQPYSFHAASEVLGVYELLQERARTRLFTWGTLILGAAFLGSSALFAALLRAKERARQSLVERAALEERLHAAQRLELVGQFTGGVAHDFNNLVTIIVGYAAVGAARASADPVLAEALAEIRKAGDRASDLVRHLLAFGRKEVVEPRLISIHAEIESIGPMLHRLLGDRVRVVLDLAADQDRVFMDPGQFSRVLLNLAANASDAMPDGGTIRIETTVSSDRDASGTRSLQLVVADTGCGMPADVRARVFEPFFTTKSPGRGTGLGLSVVRGIVEQAGGTIGVESEPDAGTRFLLRWPLASEALPEATPQADPFVGRTVIVVEDRPELRTLVERVLGGAGYDVLSAADGADGLALLQAHAGRVAVVVSDVLMPRVSGPALLARARSDGLDVPCLFITGHAEEAEAATALPGVRLLAKPFTPTQLLDAVASLIASR